MLARCHAMALAPQLIGPFIETRGVICLKQKRLDLFAAFYLGTRRLGELLP